MKEIKSIPYHYLEYAIVCNLSCLMLAIPFLHYLVLKQLVVYSYLPNGIYFFAGISLLLLILILINKHIEIKWGIAESLILVLGIFGLLSTMSSLVPEISFFGARARDEGLLMLLCYYLFFLMATLIKSPKVKKHLIIIMIFLGIVHSLYGGAQYFDLFKSAVINKYGKMASGVAGNPNFFGSLQVLLIGLSIGLFYYAKGFAKKVVYLILAVTFLGTMILTKTMSAMFGVVVIAVIFASYIIITHRSKRIAEKVTSAHLLGGGLLLFALLLVVFNTTTNGYLYREMIGMYQEITQMVSTGEINESFGSGRFIVWKNALSLVPKYFIFGSGIDTFEYAYHAVFPKNLGMVFDKAHNEYLQMALTQGVPALVTYLCLLSYVGYRAFLRFQAMYYNESWEKEYENMYFGLFLAVCGYLAQAFFNISVIDVAPYYWIVLGLLAGSNSKVLRKQKFEKTMFVITEGGVKAMDENIYYEQ